MNADSRRAKYRQEFRDQILDAARRIAACEGYAHFPMRRLAEEVDCSPGALYLHFKSKEELFCCLVEESFARLYGALEGLLHRESGNPVERLKQGLRIYVDFGLHNPEDYRLAFLLRPPAQRGAYRPHPAFEVLRTLVRGCIASGLLRTAEVETASQALWAAVHGVTSLLIERPAFPWVSKEALIRRVIDSAVYGLAASRRQGRERGKRDARIIT